MSVFRVRFKVAGGHVHCRLFAAPRGGATFAKCGDFTVRRGDEFQDLTRAFRFAEYISDDDEPEAMLEACRP